MKLYSLTILIHILEILKSKTYKKNLLLNHNLILQKDILWWRKLKSLRSEDFISFEKFSDTMSKFNTIYSKFVSEIKDWKYDRANNEKCQVCLELEATSLNLLLKCYLCGVHVHQECYGVTYIPREPWLCQKCLSSHETNPKCVLCPNFGGPYKKTADGRWCHVNCALWIPECGFSRAIYLEPIDFISEIPDSRYKFTCSVCHQKKSGACIQCYKQGCYSAFHVTCGIKMNFQMKIEIVSDLTPDGALVYSVKKTAYCAAHSENSVLNSSPSSTYQLEQLPLSTEKFKSMPANKMDR